MTKRLTDFKILTLDTYGTLIAWETGLDDALKPLLLQVERSREAVLEDFAITASARSWHHPANCRIDFHFDSMGAPVAAHREAIAD